MKTLYKYIIVSLLATVADLTVFTFWKNVTTSSAAATLAGMTVGAVVTWILYRFWVFTHSQESEKHQMKTFFLGVLVCIGLNVALMALCVDYLEFPNFPSRIVTSVFIWLLLYWYNNRVVFKV
jgi:putative flippase GtrA